MINQGEGNDNPLLREHCLVHPDVSLFFIFFLKWQSSITGLYYMFVVFLYRHLNKYLN